jgi:ABC-type amino acid transport system permease subunit
MPNTPLSPTILIMDLPSFVWLWKIAAWSMGLSLLAYLLLAVTGILMFQVRTSRRLSFIPAFGGENQKVRDLHFLIGCCMVSLVMLLLAIGIVGTYGHFGSLGHSSHLLAGLIVVALVLVSAFSATQIKARKSWARPLHIGTNIILFIGFAWVSITGWIVVQKYLP